MVIEHTVDIFQKNEQVDEIAIVVHPNCYSQVESLILNNNWNKVKKVLYGGKERCESSLAAIKAYENDKNVNLIFHDAVRPLVSDRVIRDVISSLDKYEAVDVGITTADTIISINPDENFIVSIPNRNNLRRGQTPQAFKIDTIKKAYEIALKDPCFKTTDDCGVV